MNDVALGAPVVVRVKSVWWSRNPSGIRGCMFSGEEVDREGRVADTSGDAVAKAPASLLAGVTVERGQWWRVEGARERFARSANGVVLTETKDDSRRSPTPPPQVQCRCVSLGAILRTLLGGSA